MQEYRKNELVFLRSERVRCERKVKQLKYQIEEQKKFIEQLVKENKELKKALDSKE